MTVIALVMAPMPAGARSAPQAKSTKGRTELMSAMPATRSHTAGVKRARACQKKGIRMSAPSANRAATSGMGPKSAAATRMKRNEPPQTAPSSVSSTGVRHPAESSGGAPALGAPRTGFASLAAVASDAEADTLLARESGVGCGRGPCEQRLYAAKARGHRRDAHTPRELLGRALSAFELETQYAAEARKQPPCARVPRVRLETRIVHPRYRRVGLEELCDALGAVVLVTHPQREGLQSALEQERRVRIERAAEVIGAVPDVLDGRGIADE